MCQRCWSGRIHQTSDYTRFPCPDVEGEHTDICWTIQNIQNLWISEISLPMHIIYSLCISRCSRWFSDWPKRYAAMPHPPPLFPCASAKPWKPPKLPKIHLHLPRSGLRVLLELFQGFHVYIRETNIDNIYICRCFIEVCIMAFKWQMIISKFNSGAVGLEGRFGRRSHRLQVPGSRFRRFPKWRKVREWGPGNRLLDKVPGTRCLVFWGRGLQVLWSGMNMNSLGIPPHFICDIGLRGSHLPTLEECASWAGARGLWSDFSVNFGEPLACLRWPASTEAACAGASAIALLLQHDELSLNRKTCYGGGFRVDVGNVSKFMEMWHK